MSEYSLDKVYEKFQETLKPLQPRPEHMTRNQIIVLMAEYLELFEASFYFVHLVDENGDLEDDAKFREQLKQEQSEAWREFIQNEGGMNAVGKSSFSVLNAKYQDLVSTKPCHKKIIDYYLQYSTDRSIYFKVHKYCSLSSSIRLICPYFPNKKQELLEKIDIECSKVNCEQDPVLTQTYKDLLRMVRQLIEAEQEI